MSSIAINRAAAAAPISAQVATAQVFALASNPAVPANVQIPGKLALEGKRFSVRAEGNAIVTVGTTTFKPTLLAGLVIPASPLVVASWTTIAAGAAVAIGSSTLGSAWWINADLILDSGGGFMMGVWSQLVNNAWTAPAALGNEIGPGINGTNQNVTQNSVVYAPADPIVFLAVAGTFSAAAANVGNLMNFEVSF